MATNTNTENKEHNARAYSRNVAVSTKQGVELSNSLRYRSTSYAKKFLEDVIALRRAVPYTRYIFDLGHKRGMGPGRYPQKTAQEFLRLIKSVEANAQVRGLNVASLKIIKLVTNKASIPPAGGRQRHHAKRSNIDIEVREISHTGKKAELTEKLAAKKEARQPSSSAESKKKEMKATTPLKPGESS